LKELLTWLKNTKSITYIEDGFVDSETMLSSALSNHFVSSCNFAQRRNIPYLYYDQIAVKMQSIPEFGIASDIQFIMIPSLCFNKLKSMPDKLATTLYSLLRYCSFVSFTSDTIVKTIISNNNIAIDELIEPFMCCTSDCDMTSFKSVYLGAIRTLKQTDEVSALQLARVVLANAKKIWTRGTYYRLISKNYKDIRSEIKAKAIKQYVEEIVLGIRSIYPLVTPEISKILDDLEKQLISDGGMG
jgi:hypothetical protein